MASTSRNTDWRPSPSQNLSDHFFATLNVRDLASPDVISLVIDTLGLAIYDLPLAVQAVIKQVLGGHPRSRPPSPRGSEADVEPMVERQTPEQRSLLRCAKVDIELVPDHNSDGPSENFRILSQLLQRYLKPGQTLRLDGTFGVSPGKTRRRSGKKSSSGSIVLKDTAGATHIAPTPDDALCGDLDESDEQMRNDALGFPHYIRPLGYLAALLDLADLGQRNDSFNVEVDLVFGLNLNGTVIELSYHFRIYTSVAHLLQELPRKEAELVRYILHGCFPPTEPLDFSANETPLQTFYGAMRPAKVYPARLDAILTPPGLVSTLRPYQKRTLAFLLQMEDAIELDPYFAHPGMSDPDGIWERLTVGDGEQSFNIAFARSTGDIRAITRAQEDEYQRRRKGKTKELEVQSGKPDWLQFEDGYTAGRGYGAMLCEEMGLGKSVEAIALMLLRRRPGTYTTSYNSVTEMDVTQVAATLVVTPRVLFDQWISEFQKHAPSLRVLVYQGYKKHYAAFTVKQAKQKRGAQTGHKRKRVLDEDDYLEDDDSKSRPLVRAVLADFVHQVQQHDVVLCTFNDVAGDFAVTETAPKRARRDNVDYKIKERPMSALLAVEWARIIQDESQLIAGTQAATVARIPRAVSIAMSGTPARAEVLDLGPTLDFINLPVPTRLWKGLQLAPFLPALTSLMSTSLVRTLKRDVAQESGLTRQRRLVIPLRLGRLETDYYRDCLEKGWAIIERGTAGGTKAPDADKVRAMVHDLREICLHIQVGSIMGARKLDGKRRVNLGAKLLTMQEASKLLFQEAQADTWTLEREMHSAKLRKALLTQHQLNRGERVSGHAQCVFAEGMFKDTCAELEVTVDTVYTLLREFASDENGVDEVDDSSSDSASEIDMDITPAQHREDEERQGRKTTLHQQLRLFRMLLHEAKYRMGDLYFNMREKEDEEHPLEKQSYEAATALRSTLMKRAFDMCTRGVADVNRAIGETGINDFGKLEIAELDHRGIRSYEITDRANDTINALNENLAQCIWPWRGEIARLLATPVVPEEASAEDYEAGLDTQVKLQSYLDAYLDQLAVHKDMLDVNREVIVTRKATQEKQRKAQMDRNKRRELKADSLPDASEAIKNAYGREKDTFEQMVGNHAASLAPAKEAVEEAFKAGASIMGIIVELIGVRNDNDLRREELAIANNLVDRLKQIRTAQKEALDLFGKEVEVFRRAMNRRITALAALQEISDSVALLEDPQDRNAREVAEQSQAQATSIDNSNSDRGEGSSKAPSPTPEMTSDILEKKRDWRAKELDKAAVTAQDAQLSLVQAAARLRFLRHINEKQDDDSGTCIVCKEDFGTADAMEVVLLGCAHSFCHPCFVNTRERGEKKCMICRGVIDPGALRKVTYRQQKDGTMQTVIAQDGKTKQVTVNTARVDPDLFHVMLPIQEVLGIDVFGEYGTKIDFLIRHILYLRKKERSTRHLVFTSWSVGLDIVQTALRMNGIKSIGVNEPKAAEKFQQDEQYSVFLLNSEKQSAGLTLTAASVVHMLNPVLSQSFELQAIGRVDRVGQTKDTTVYCYVAEDTIETRILHRDLRRGSSIYTKVEGMDPTDHAQGRVFSAGKRADDAGGSTQDLLDLLRD